MRTRARPASDPPSARAWPGVPPVRRLPSCRARATPSRGSAGGGVARRVGFSAKRVRRALRRAPQLHGGGSRHQRSSVLQRAHPSRRQPTPRACHEAPTTARHPRRASRRLRKPRPRHAGIAGPREQHADSGAPSWLRRACLVLVVLLAGPSRLCPARRASRATRRPLCEARCRHHGRLRRAQGELDGLIEVVARATQGNAQGRSPRASRHSPSRSARAASCDARSDGLFRRFAALRAARSAPRSTAALSKQLPATRMPTRVVGASRAYGRSDRRSAFGPTTIQEERDQRTINANGSAQADRSRVASGAGFPQRRSPPERRCRGAT